MTKTILATVEKMLEVLPENAQERVVEHMREYIQDLQDEILWDEQFKRTQKQLINAARQAKKEIAAGKAKPMDYDRL